MSVLDSVRTRIFADGADLTSIIALSRDPLIAGFTTNPTLMRSAGVTNYATFAKEVLEVVTAHPISFEVFADTAGEILRQARVIATWGDNVYVKVPVTTTQGESLSNVVSQLSRDGIKVNVTAVFTLQQVENMTEALCGGAPSYISIFAGRIADAGIDPVPILRQSLNIMSASTKTECIWASPREVLNLVQANEVGCHIITMTPDLLKKLSGIGKDLSVFSLETVEMFHRDAVSANFSL